MALSASFIWKNPDATKDLNARIKRIVNRGIVWGGEINPGVGLTVQINPFVGVSFDGMTVADTDPHVFTVGASQKNYVVVRARYNEGGMPATPTLAWQVLPEASYLTDAEKDYLIVFGVIDLGAVVSVTTNDIYYAEYRDEVDSLGRSWYRGTVSTTALLPVPPPHMNWVGDFYWVQTPPADNTLHFWDGTSWIPLATGAAGSETSLMNSSIIKAERDRITNGSGVIAGVRPTKLNDFASEEELTFHDGASAVNFEIGIDAFTAIVNGHFVEVHAQNVTLSAPPVAPFRYDLVFLEVWRELIASPDTQTYARNPDGSLTYTLEEVDTQLEELLWQQGISPANNFDLNAIESDNHLWYVTKWRLGVANDVPNTALWLPASPTVANLATNIDGVMFGTSLPSTDPRVWIATSAVTPADGKSWAIPIAVIKRLSSESLPANNVQVFRNNIRYVFPIHALTDKDNVAKVVTDVHYNESDIFNDQEYEKPSGFISDVTNPLGTVKTAPPNTIRLADKPIKIRMRGLEDVPIFEIPSFDMYVGDAPTVGWARTLVYIKMNITLYDNTASPGLNENYYISSKHRPYIPLEYLGWKKGYVQFEIVYENLGATDVLDEHDAMAASALGWTRGDVTKSGTAVYDDGGLWSRTISIVEDERVHPLLAEWAIPFCLIHRRNQGAWTRDLNPNGTGASRPDDRKDYTIISPDDLVDLRHTVDLTPADCEALMRESLDKMMKGDLRTRMANKYQGAGSAGVVAGSRILQTDSIGPLTGAYQLTTPDGYRTIWSDAKEFALVAMELDLTAPSSSSTIHSWSVSGSVGTLTIKSPVGASIVRHIPGAVHAVGDTTRAEALDFLGPPCWGTQWDDLSSFITSLDLAHACALTYDSITNATGILLFKDYNSPVSVAAPAYAQPFKVNSATLDPSGRATEMTGYVNTAATTEDRALLAFWVHYDRTFVGNYAANYGLAEIPDTVHKATLDPTGSPQDLHIGPIYTVIEKAVSGASVTITAANVTAATGTPGTVKLWGVDNYTAVFEPTASISSVTLDYIAQTTITINLTVPITGKIRIKVYYESDINKWIEVGRGGKSVQAICSWGSKDDIDLGATPPAVADYTFGLGSSFWTTPPFGKNVAPGLPIVYTRASLLADWTAVGGGFLRHPYSNAISLKPLITAGRLDQYVMVIWPEQTPLAPADRVQIDYSYTPYQGQSSSGGAVAVPATAVPKLKKMLHGRIEGNTEFYVTQSGAASVYSGVNTFSGKPVNNMSYTSGGPNSLTLASDRLSIYNRTALVSPPAPYGSVDLLSLSEDEKYSLNAAAVLRLPFPMNPAMLSSLFPSYHAGVMDFDLDPERAGAAAGHLQYAPGYPNSGYSTGTTPRYHTHQFVNGLSRLCASGDMSKRAINAVISADKFQTTQTVATCRQTSVGWAGFISGDRLDVTGSTDKSGIFESVLRTITPFRADASMGTPAVGNGGVRLYNLYSNTLLSITGGITDHARYLASTAFSVGANGNFTWWTAIDGFTPGGDVDYVYCTTPAVVTEYRREVYAEELHPIVHIFIQPTSVTARTFATQMSVDAEDWDAEWVTYWGGAPNTRPLKLSVDLIIVPMESGQRATVFDISSNNMAEANSVTTLKGREVKYPDEWTPATETQVEALIAASDNGRGAGRGVYLGGTTKRLNMPMFVPGTGTSLEATLKTLRVIVDDPISPATFPVSPTRPIFDRSNIVYVKPDIGGPIAYVCYGTLIRPKDADYMNHAVLQVSGGPTGGVDVGSSLPMSHTSQALDGQAIDAFWMPGRPILSPK